MLMNVTGTMVSESYSESASTIESRKLLYEAWKPACRGQS